jgi:uncharacterized protein
MKYLLVLLVVVLVLWAMRSVRRVDAKPSARAARPPGAQPEEMVSCLHCGVHLPRRDAVTGPQGLYCSDAHRLAGPAR